jgi:tol-pal system protein YbgF
MIQKLLLVACVCASLLPVTLFGAATVVDDSENYALLEEQQETYESPVVRDRDDYSVTDSEPALAKDDHQLLNNNASLLQKIQGLQQDIQELRGQLEMQTHDLKRLQDQQLSFYKDLDARISQSPHSQVMNTASTPSTTAATPLSSSNATTIVTPPHPVINSNKSNPANEQISYLAAYELVKNKHFDEALSAMQAFVIQYPHGGYTANAQYWLGELCLVKNDYAKAIEHFNHVLHEFPSSSKSAASLLKIGYAQAALGQTPEARLTLQTVIKNYPDTHTAQLAITKLNALNHP